MAYDEKVAERLRGAFTRLLSEGDDIEERKMFGGVAELVNGHMCVGVIDSDLVVRVPPADADAAVAEKHARPMDFTGKPMRGWVYVAPAGFRTDAALDRWVAWGLAFVRQAGPKKPVKRRKKPVAPKRRTSRATKRA